MNQTFAPHEQRVIDERTEVSARLEKLLAFITSPMFTTNVGADEKARMRRQAAVMTEYVEILGARIAAFSSPQDDFGQRGFTAGDFRPTSVNLNEDWLTAAVDTRACALRNNGDEICESCQ